MRFHVPTGRFTVDSNALSGAALNLRYALSKIRELAGLPLDRYPREGALTDADHAQKGVLDAAAAMGIDFGASWGNELDLRDPE